MAELTVLEGALGHRFADRMLLDRALTHKSRAHERATVVSADSDNEQLEFLGDAILGFVVSACLVRQFPDAEEGRLSKMKAHLVSAAHLHGVAQEMALGDYLYLGKGEEMSGGRAKKTLLADALEALIAAMYLDGGMDPARAFVERVVVGGFTLSQENVDSSVRDYKSALQEAAQTLGLPPPRYSTAQEDGPEHSKTFTVEVRIGTSWIARAQGPSKKAAGQKAAEQILRDLAASKA
jgi:ribonuclease-3